MKLNILLLIFICELAYLCNGANPHQINRNQNLTKNESDRSVSRPLKQGSVHANQQKQEQQSSEEQSAYTQQNVEEQQERSGKQQQVSRRLQQRIRTHRQRSETQQQRSERQQQRAERKQQRSGGRRQSSVRSIHIIYFTIFTIGNLHDFR